MAETAAKKKYYLGTGRRKTSVARVRLSDGSGKMEINGRPLDNYFTEVKDRNAVVGPLKLTEQTAKLDVAIKVHGGGTTGQAGAICQGTARALITMFAGVTTTPDDAAGGMIQKLKDSGYLTRDGRMKERKKYGRKGVCRSFQFSKR